MGTSRRSTGASRTLQNLLTDCEAGRAARRELLYGLTLRGFVGGLRVFCILWFASGAAFFVGTIGGFLFGVPKARTEPGGAERSASKRGTYTEPSVAENSSNAPTPSEALIQDLYRDNTNLEEVSDWLTKIIIGIGLVEFNQITTLLGQIGDRVGTAVDPTGYYGGKVIAVGSIVIGFATGFLYYYVWARLILRRSLITVLERERLGTSKTSAGEQKS
jgi:hypothetical protein